MRINGSKARFNPVERFLLGWRAEMPVNDVPWQSAAAEVADHKRALHRFSPRDSLTAVAYAVDCFFTEAKMKRMTNVAASIFLHQMEVLDELAPDYPEPDPFGEEEL